MFSLTTFERELQALLARIAQSPEISQQQPRLCVALSGGLDSTVLLEALCRLSDAGRVAGRVRALHVDHGLHADSAQWAAACRAHCTRRSISYDEVRVTVRRGDGSSLEAAARAARYAALAESLTPGEVLLTAHHADDQLETILLQSLRGGGLSAVAGMAPYASFGAGSWHLRPLLAFSRAELATWARDEQLHWLEDPSNADSRFDRNYLRLEVLPRLRERWPSAARSYQRIAEYARDALVLEDETAARDLPLLLRGCALDLESLQALPEPRQRAALRAWLRGCGLAPPSRAVLESLRNDALRAAPDRNPTTHWTGGVVHRYRGRLYAVSAAESAPQGTEVDPAGHLLPPGGALTWQHGSSVELVPSRGAGLSCQRVGGALTVRARQDGESFVPAGGPHRRDLRKWLQEHGVLPWRRGDLPIVCNDAGEVVAIADLVVAQGYAATADEPAWRVAWLGRGLVTEADALALRWPVTPPIR